MARADDRAVVFGQQQIDGVVGVELILLEPIGLAQFLRATHPLGEDAVPEMEHVVKGVLVQVRIATGGTDFEHGYFSCVG